MSRATLKKIFGGLQVFGHRSKECQTLQREKAVNAIQRSTLLKPSNLRTYALKAVAHVVAQSYTLRLLSCPGEGRVRSISDPLF